MNGNSASFKFNFFGNQGTQAQETVSSDSKRLNGEESKKNACYVSTESAPIFEDFPCFPLNVANLNFIHYAGAIGGATDIVPGQFEGGHRIWQGCIDLLRYLEENPFPVNASTVVVELGCGHGLPGCYMLRKGARVYFQDYNEDSLEKATLPTIVVNCGVDAVNRAKLICAEWSQTAAMIPEPKVDLILASDTIYTPATIRAFISVVNQIATPETMVVIASQRYYFGLGGGTQALNALIEELHLPLRVETSSG
ncbi:hypothetical protein BLSTO_00143 [Blastocystis sp. subtype 1]